MQTLDSAEAASRFAGAGIQAPGQYADDPRGRAPGGGDESRLAQMVADG